MISKAATNSSSKFQIQIIWYCFTKNHSSLFPLNLSQENPSPRTSRHISSSLSVYLFLNSELYLGKSNNSIIKECKNRSTEHSKATFCHKKFHEEADRLCVKLSSALDISGSFFYCLLFFEEYLNRQVRINKMVNELTVNYQPSPSGLSLKTYTLIFQWIHEGFYHFSEHLLIFFLNL